MCTAETVRETFGNKEVSQKEAEFKGLCSPELDGEEEKRFRIATS